ncbi:hypothetical protein OVA24_09815 [Luteolibacter sp. SL250]|uniref:hypothetical protein n=1 Tax=Luteolibacter sp. SL250 TaxID=2995170 RepID=UPI0022711E93|nr:hypothetical protein [Luteolibacter sp. SL250]WAC21681.1 hypothetical protein OVA24_09815 [Luteolibacter sp. SL250]
MAFGDNWHLRSRARECTATETPFTNGQQIITAIFPDPESSGYLRKDFSLDGWSGRADDAPKPFSFWKTTFTSTATAEKPATEKLSAEEILRRLIEEDEDHTENTRYILAVMLERQKLLRETDNQRTPNGIIRVYEHKKTGEVMIVRDPDIPLAEIEKVQEEVVVLLENNGRVPEPEHPQDVVAESPQEEASAETATDEAEEAALPDESDEDEDGETEKRDS